MDQNERTVGAARPEYVDFDVDGFPGGLPACLEAVLMVCDQPQQAADLARVLAVDEERVTAALCNATMTVRTPPVAPPGGSSCAVPPGGGSSPVVRCSNRWCRRS